MYEDGKLAAVYKNYDWKVHWLRGSKAGTAPDECWQGWCYNGIQGDPGNYVDAGCYEYTQGPHNFSIHVFEDCCDGHSELEIHLLCDRATNAWRLVASGASACLECNGRVVAASCSAHTSSAGQCGSTGGAIANCPANGRHCTTADTFTPRCSPDVQVGCCCDTNRCAGAAPRCSYRRRAGSCRRRCECWKKSMQKELRRRNP